ncbi:hypothetical protein DL771_000799 [Monosporascus sp. 5C6A]|nr:hypothetical protein DL771_000799 [Monosporascus sp. 5C6A]
MHLVSATPTLNHVRDIKGHCLLLMKVSGAQEIFDVPADPDQLERVMAPGYDATACDHIAVDNEEHQMPSVWGTDNAADKESWVRRQHVLSGAGPATHAGGHGRAAYGPADEKDLVDLVDHFHKKRPRKAQTEVPDSQGVAADGEEDDGESDDEESSEPEDTDTEELEAPDDKHAASPGGAAAAAAAAAGKNSDVGEEAYEDTQFDMRLSKFDVRFERVILDEAQYVRHKDSGYWRLANLEWLNRTSHH